MFLVAPILTRLYSPSDFGVLAVYGSTLGILGAAACLGYELAIPMPKEPREAVELLLIALTLATLVSLGFAGLLSLFGEFLALLTNAPEVARYLWLFPIGLFGIGWYAALTHWAIRKGAFPVLARTKLVQGLSGAGIQVVLGLLKLTPMGLLLGHIANQSAGVALLARRARQDLRLALALTSVSSILKTASRHRNFPLLLGWSSVLNRVGILVPPILVAALFGPQVAGLLALSDRVARAPSNLLVSAVSQVVFSRAASKGGQASGELRNLAIQMSKRLFIIAAPVVLLVAVFASWLFGAVFGPEWREAGRFLQLLSIAYLAQVVVSPLARLMIVVKRKGLMAAFDSVRAVLVAASILVPGALGASASRVLLSYSITMTLTYVAFYVLVLWSLKETGLSPETS